uniref:Uncharacterized protein n=1 Tax=Nicotiana tabacum TaxID=4097 RepID=A0A1S4DP99_TOBAC|nr:PREDICTED: uncharacterized protein LOC107831977 [Nicotiana tabacum]
MILMDAPLNFEECQSTYRLQRFNGKYYGWWKNRMHDFIMAENSELWDVICDGPFVPSQNLSELGVVIPKTRKEFNDADRKFIEIWENNRISTCQLAKEIWEALQTAHKGTTQVKQSKIDMLTTEYELFKMEDDESIQDMYTQFTSIINELYSLGESILRNKLVRKILNILPSSWESKFSAITKAKDLQTLATDELVGNLKTYEMKKKKDNERREPNREKNLVLKTNSNDSSGEDEDMAYLTRKFQKIVRRNGAIPKRGTRALHQGLPQLKQDQYNNNLDKAAKRNQVPDKHFKRKNDANNSIKQALVAWGESSSEYEEENTSSMMVVETETTKYDSLFALMTRSDDDEDDDGDEVAVKNRDISWIRVVENNAELWDRRPRYESTLSLNKLALKDLVRDLTKLSIKEHKVCNARAKGKYVRSPFKPKKEEGQLAPQGYLIFLIWICVE